MACVHSSADWISFQLFLPATDVEPREILDLAAETYNRNPEIEAAILRDQDAVAVEKRRLREADRKWHEERAVAGIPTLFASLWWGEPPVRR
jgi:hypothetical protein